MFKLLQLNKSFINTYVTVFVKTDQMVLNTEINSLMWTLHTLYYIIRHNHDVPSLGHFCMGSSSGGDGCTDP